MMRVVVVKRRRLRRLRRRRLKILRAFSSGKVSRDQAIRALGLRDYAGLLVVLGVFGVPLPRLPDADIDRMVEDFLSVWKWRTDDEC